MLRPAVRKVIGRARSLPYSKPSASLVQRLSNLKPHKINSTNGFIAGWYLDDKSICDSLIRYHKESPTKRQGLMSGGGGRVDKESKDSIDVTLPPSELANVYIEMLNDAAKEYVAKYPWSGKLVPWGVIEPIGIQHYGPGGGYKIWHFERDNTNDQIARRHLAFMTYLNDVEEGGGTEFFHQELTVKAEKGLTLIWPAEWNFTHRGVVSNTEEKYIITGWFSTYTKEQFERLRQKFGTR
ncbi:MAG TPA: 2OG-Fe(II) oxygenase [Gammaproteobacteria bacterium]